MLFYLQPALEGFLGIAGVDFAKNVGMPPNELGMNVLDHAINIESPFLLRQTGIENHLKEQVA